MIILTTGVPGAGKTLYALHQVKTRVEAENAKLEAEGKPPRQVFYSGIADLKLPWIELEDAKEWNSLPAGSVIVIDECQRVFRPRASGSAVPPYISALETHRHKGYDLYLITQHPNLVDQNIRRLVGKHQHIVRKFGISAATVHEWGSTHEITQRNLLSAVRTTWPYSKEVFGYYKSAELHTHKAKLPKRVWFLIFAPLLLGALFWFGYQKALNVGKLPEQAPKLGEQMAGVQPIRVKTPAEERAEYFQKAVPRVPGLYHTAPKYDDITKPTDAPFPTACMITKGFDQRIGENVDKCGCIDQQGNRYQTDSATCRKIAINGVFKEWGRKEGGPEERPKARDDHRAPRSPEDPIQANQPSTDGSPFASYGPVAPVSKIDVGGA